MEQYLGYKCLHTSILDIPTKLSHAPSGSPKGVTIVAEVAQVVLVVSSLVQPCSSPKQLVLHTPNNINSMKNIYHHTLNTLLLGSQSPTICNPTKYDRISMRLSLKQVDQLSETCQDKSVS